jgi:GNAT superfamily N-acetyltransferase
VTTMTIRRASDHDLGTFRRLSSMLFESDSRFDPNFNKKWPFTDEARKYFAAALADGICLVAESAGEPIGLLDAGVQATDTTATILRSEIGQIYVVPAWRRRGVGRQLMRTYLEWCSEMRVDEIVVGVFEANVEALEFYRSIGLGRWIVRLNGDVDQLEA